MKKNIKIFLILLITLITISSCRSKKKVSEKEVIKIERTEDKKVSEISEESVITDSIVDSKSEVITTDHNESIEVIAANDSTVVNIKKEVTEDVIHWSISGSKSFKIIKEETETKASDSTSIKVNTNESININKTEETNIDESVNTRKRNTDSESTGISFGFYIWLIIIIIIIFIFGYLKKRFGTIRNAWSVLTGG